MKNEKQSTLTFRVGGMDCASCANSIQSAVSKLDEVTQANITFTTGKLVVEARDGEGLEGKIQQTVTQLGYQIQKDDVNYKGEKEKSTEFLFLLATTILFVVGMILHSINHHLVLALLFFVPVLLYCGAKVFPSAFKSLRIFSLDMNVLIAVATLAALVLGEWMEAVMILYLYQVGLFFQKRALRKTKSAVNALMNLSPKTVLKKVGEDFVETSIEEVKVKDVLLVRAGDAIGLDGIVLSGTTSVNQASLTGESIPVEKHPGEDVFAGTVNETSPIEMIVTKASEQSTLSKMIRMVEEAEEKKSKTETTIDQFSKIYTPVVFLVSLLLMLIPFFVFGQPLHEWVVKGIELLLVACPCALVISTPVSIVSGIGAGAKNGLLIKGGEVFEDASNTKVIALDKTGTLTMGRPNVEEIFSVSSYSEEEITKIAASLEKNSTHPLAKSVQEFAKGIEVPRADETKNIVGIGVTGSVDGVSYTIGKKDKTKCSTDVFEEIERKENQGLTVMVLYKEEEAIGYLTVADPVKETSQSVVEKLMEVGLKPVLLTGDNETVANRIAQVVGIKQVFANCLPEDKLQKIQALSKTSGVAMVGDGINDAPSLAQANVGIAMGQMGSDIAMNAADVVLLEDDLERIPFLFQLSKRVVRTIHINILVSIVVKILAIFLIFLGVLPIWLAILSDSLVSIFVTLNALRLLRMKA